MCLTFQQETAKPLNWCQHRKLNSPQNRIFFLCAHNERQTTPTPPACRVHQGQQSCQWNAPCMRPKSWPKLLPMAPNLDFANLEPLWLMQRVSRLSTPKRGPKYIWAVKITALHLINGSKWLPKQWKLLGELNGQQRIFRCKDFLCFSVFQFQFSTQLACNSIQQGMTQKLPSFLVSFNVLWKSQVTVLFLVDFIEQKDSVICFNAYPKHRFKLSASAVRLQIRGPKVVPYFCIHFSIDWICPCRQLHGMILAVPYISIYFVHCLVQKETSFLEKEENKKKFSQYLSLIPPCSHI